MSQPETSNPVTPAASAPKIASTPLNDLSSAVSWLVIGLLLLAASFGAFVFKANRNLTLQTNGSIKLAQDIQKTLQSKEALAKWEHALNDLAAYSKDNPELAQVFRSFGIDVSGAGGQKPPPTPPPAP